MCEIAVFYIDNKTFKKTPLFKAESFYAVSSVGMMRLIEGLFRLFMVCRIGFFPLRKSQNRPADQLNDVHEKHEEETSYRECIPEEQNRDRLCREIRKEYPREMDCEI